jgi:hypothetical protein
VKLIHSVAEDKPIRGLTILNNQLYVRCEKLYYDDDTKKWYGDEGNDDKITIYDTETLTLQGHLQVPHLGGVSDMTSCRRHQCIYISDWKKEIIHRVKNKDNITQWSVDDMPDGLSVNSVFNVLATCYRSGKIKEFTTDGQLIREIRLHSDIAYPWHTIELTTDQFVVCHGRPNDQRQTVSIVDSNECVLQSYVGLMSLSGPSRVAFHGFVFVADMNNHRVLMFSPTVKYIREVVSGLGYPSRMSFDEQTGRLYIADNNSENKTFAGGNIKVYTF